MTDVAQNPGTLTLAQAARIMREALRDKSYQLTPLGAEIAGYLRIKRKRLAVTSYRTYESSLQATRCRCATASSARDHCGTMTRRKRDEREHGRHRPQRAALR